MSNDQDETKQDDKTKPKPSIGNELSAFIAHITSLAESLPLTMEAIVTAHEKTYKQFREFEKENIKYEEEDGRYLMLVRADAFQRFRELDKQLRNLALAFKTIPQSIVVSLVSQYDAFLGRLVRVLLLITHFRAKIGGFLFWEPLIFARQLGISKMSQQFG